MLPDASHTQSSQAPIQGAPVSSGKNATANSAAANPQIVEQTQQLIAQFISNPFRLSGALQELKADHLAKQYNIRPNSNE